MSLPNLAAFVLLACSALASNSIQDVDNGSPANIDTPAITRRSTTPAAFSAPSLDVITAHYLPLTFVPGKQKQRKLRAAIPGSNRNGKRSKSPGYGAAPLDNDVYTGNFNVEVKLGEQLFSVRLHGQRRRKSSPAAKC